MKKAAKNTDWPRIIKVGHASVTVYRMAHAGADKGVTHVVAWLSPSGRQRRKIADESKALEEARLIAGKLSSGKLEAAEMTGSEREELLEARRMAGSTPLLSALREWTRARQLAGADLVAAAQAWKDLHGTTRKEITMREALKAFLTAKERQGVDTKASYRKTLPRLNDSTLADLPINVVTAAMLDDWIHETFKQGENETAHPATFNTVRKRLVSLYRWARKQSYLPRTAQTEAEQLESAQETRETIGIMGVDNFRDTLALMRSEHPEHLAVTALAGFTGLRRSELHAQAWKDINLGRGFLRVTSAKKNTPAMRLVQLPAACVEWLMVCPRKTGEEGALVSPPWGIDLVRKWAKEKEIHCPENAFRHSFISYRVAKTSDVAATALEAGNSATVIFKHYRELVGKPEGEAWFSISPNATTTGEVVEFPAEKTA
jgi:integrase